MELLLGPNDDGRRADRIVRKALPDLPLSAIHRLFRSGKIRSEGKRIRADSRLYEGDCLILQLSAGDSAAGHAELPRQLPRDQGSLPFSIIFHNEHYLIVNKAPGILVHGPQSLEQDVARFLAPLIPPSLSFRPGPLHRLDRETGGIIVFSASLEGARSFSQAMREHQLKKEYLALLSGNLEQEILWDAPLIRDKERKMTLEAAGGKEARSLATPLAHRGNMTLARISIEGGRTHQIRSHAAGAGFPLVNDCKYGGPKEPHLAQGRFMLHAQVLEQRADCDLALPRRLEAPLPSTFLAAIEEIFGPTQDSLVIY